MLHEDFAGMRAGMTAGHRAAKAAIKARRPDLPVGLSLAIVDDVAVPGGEELRDRKRAEVYEHWLELARDDDFIGVRTTSASSTAPADTSRRGGRAGERNGHGGRAGSLRGAVEYVYAVSGVPVLVSEHGIGTEDDTIRAAFIEPSLAGLRSGDRRRCAGARLLPLDAHGQLRVDLGYGPKLGCTAWIASVRAHGEAELGRVGGWCGRRGGGPARLA